MPCWERSLVNSSPRSLCDPSVHQRRRRRSCRAGIQAGAIRGTSIALALRATPLRSERREDINEIGRIRPPRWPCWPWWRCRALADAQSRGGSRAPAPIPRRGGEPARREGAGAGRPIRIATTGPAYHYGGYYPGYRSTFVVTGAFGYPSYWHNPWSFGIGFSFGYGYGGYGYGFGPYGYGPWGYGYAPWGYGYASPWYPYGPYPYGYWMDGATSDVRIDAASGQRGGVRRRLSRWRRRRLRRRVPAAARAVQASTSSCCI